MDDFAQENRYEIEDKVEALLKRKLADMTELIEAVGNGDGYDIPTAIFELLYCKTDELEDKQNQLKQAFIKRYFKTIPETAEQAIRDQYADAGWDEAA